MMGRQTILETTFNGRDMFFSYDEKGFTPRLR